MNRLWLILFALVVSINAFVSISGKGLVVCHGHEHVHAHSHHHGHSHGHRAHEERLDQPHGETGGLDRACGERDIRFGLCGAYVGGHEHGHDRCDEHDCCCCDCEELPASPVVLACGARVRGGDGAVAALPALWNTGGYGGATFERGTALLYDPGGAQRLAVVRAVRLNI